MLSPPHSLDPDAVALFLDVDGTLLEICDDPAQVSANADLVDVLERCFGALGGAMALVSGRSIAEVDRIFSPTVFPLAGAHGAELRIDGHDAVSASHEPLPQHVLSPIEDFVARHDGLLLEHKRSGISLHYRRAPGLEAECRERIAQAMAGVDDSYRLIAGKMVLEIAPRSHDKGAAIRLFMEKPPYAGRLPVFVGDDVTDEDGFRVVNEFAGVSIRVGAVERSEARYELANVSAVRPWLLVALLGDRPKRRYGDSRT